MHRTRPSDTAGSRRVTSAHAIALLALFVSLCGSAFAVTQIGSKQIKNNSVKSADLKDGKAVRSSDLGLDSVDQNSLAPNAVGSDEVINGSLRGEDIQPRTVGGGVLALESLTGAEVFDNSLTGADIQNGTVTGFDINEGSLAEVPLAAKLGSITAQREDFSVPDGESNSGTVYCPGGQQALGGGARAKGPLLNTEVDVLLVTSRPAISSEGGAEPNDNQSFDGWRAAAANQAGGAGNATASVWVICAG